MQVYFLNINVGEDLLPCKIVKLTQITTKQRLFSGFVFLIRLSAGQSVIFGPLNSHFSQQKIIRQRHFCYI